jgi:hypothetical protein
MTPTEQYRGHSIFVAITESGGEYHAVPVVCPAGESPYSEAAQRLQLEATFPTREQAATDAVPAARWWIDWEAALMHRQPAGRARSWGNTRWTMALAFASGLALVSGCVGTVSLYSSDRERAEFDETCAAVETAEYKAGERQSTALAVVGSTTRFECARPRLWVRVKGADKDNTLTPGVIQSDADPSVDPAVQEAAREQGREALRRAESSLADQQLAARHRAEMDDFNPVASARGA